MCEKFVTALYGSKNKLFVMKNATIVDKENNIEDENNGFWIFLMNKKVPEAATPNKAMLMSIKAKWYHCAIEKNLIREISSINVANEIKNKPV